MKDSEFISTINASNIQNSSGRVAWQSPSNLAIVKYWGKYGQQLPRNPSISITLSEAFTQTSVEFFVDKYRSKLELEFYFEGKENESFKGRITKYLEGIESYFSFIPYSKLIINSDNSFPHSSGIASSASSMSALALCLCEIENNLENDKNGNEEFFLRKASYISRLGSGSACRSVYPYFASWGKIGNEDSSNLYASPVAEFHDVFKTLRNDILIVSAEEKSVSSTKGHQLMEENPYAKTRFEQANNRVFELKSILKEGNLSAFGEMLESEALTLHALMMASDPSYLLIEPKTIKVINEIRSFRKNENIPVFFSLDAGPNVHIISFEKDRAAIEGLIENLREFAIGGKILNDSIGFGAKKIE